MDGLDHDCVPGLVDRAIHFSRISAFGILSIEEGSLDKLVEVRAGRLDRGLEV